MIDSWRTKRQDMFIAREIIAEYGGEEGLLGIFEMEMDRITGNIQKVRLSPWMQALIKHFRMVYGADKGDDITRKVLAQCLINDNTIH